MYVQHPKVELPEHLKIWFIKTAPELEVLVQGLGFYIGLNSRKLEKVEPIDIQLKWLMNLILICGSVGLKYMKNAYAYKNGKDEKQGLLKDQLRMKRVRKKVCACVRRVKAICMWVESGIESF